MIDPSDSRGHVYLQYSGPGDNGGSPRYKLWSYKLSCTVKPTVHTTVDSFGQVESFIHGCIYFLHHSAGCKVNMPLAS